MKFLGFVETKFDNLSDQWVRNLWGSDSVKWYVVNAAGRSGGILCMG